MKRFISCIIFALLANCILAQPNTDNTLKFLGIPVDGTKQQMISNLKNKGFFTIQYHLII